MTTSQKKWLRSVFRLSSVSMLLAMNIAYAQESIPLTQEHHNVQPQTLLVGSWTGTSGNPLAEKIFYPSEGIYRLRLNQDGTLLPLDVLKMQNPSWIVISHDHQYVYTTNESDNGEVSAMKVLADGRLEFINAVSTRGQHPTHATLTPDGKFLLVANYAASKKNAGFILFPILAQGKIGEPVQHIPFEKGSGIVNGRQDSGHAHSVTISPDGKMLFVADLGADKVRAYRYQPGSKTPFVPETAADLSFPAGAGPRHMTFSPDGKFAYIVTEMAAQVHVYSAEHDRLQSIQTVSLTDSTSAQDKGGAGILFSPDGKFLYIGNRQQRNEILVFKADPHNGRLTEKQAFSAGGIEPRAFAFDRSGQYMLVANVYSNNIVELSRNTQDGSLHSTGVTVQIGSPTDVKFMP
ncbi:MULTISPECIES: lactonase family protein [Tatumella]|uniref:Lactonase family protein n=1 Tax=Tatumella punctata TaxID=399969 RepID=A0ABW1VTV3_9GAMM|nr:MULTISPECIES: lactonase family protein [unclassified Tatumella]MBS0857435.1 lactonase family protein [Tatumella sp. JGM16]MBS0877798.1 lactonase family protein [Tatumella sp. JGM82]MBS0891503.1 lactonase family protein [Tatumella sp. JGM94]MBS0894410.1 lactonase family protein [Tatumella sp. JGM130]MBS0902433.1 lactonase family protein [Tatumella sp. JGM100]